MAACLNMSAPYDLNIFFFVASVPWLVGVQVVSAPSLFLLSIKRSLLKTGRALGSGVFVA